MSPLSPRLLTVVRSTHEPPQVSLSILEDALSHNEGLYLVRGISIPLSMGYTLCLSPLIRVPTQFNVDSLMKGY